MILKQTVESAIFIHEYTGRGFGGEQYILTQKRTIANRLAKETREADVHRH